MKRYGNWFRLMVVCGLMGVLCAGLSGTRLLAQDGRTVSAARQIFELTNQDRQAQGLAPFAWNDALATAAQRHADRMVGETQLSHQYPGEPELMRRAVQAGAHFQAIAENVAMAGNAQAVENAWMKSTPHRTNILDPKMNALGVGVAERGGYLFAVEDFADAAQSLNPQQVEQRVAELLRAVDVDPSGPAAAAEQACKMDSGMPQGTGARSMVRFETPDLTQLPSQVAQQIRSGGFAKAAVGACAPRETNPNFTSYRVAVLLY